MRTREYTTPNSAVTLREYKWVNNASTPLVESWSDHPYLPGGSLYTVPSTFPLVRHYMVDSTGVSGAMRPCFHTVERNVFEFPICRHKFFQGWGGNACFLGLNDGKITGTHALCVPPSYNMDELAEQALAFMMPKVNSGVSLINSLIELKDLKRANPIGSVKRIFRKYPELNKLRTPKERKRFKKELVTRLNNAHLNAAFGIAPFVRDVVNIYDELVSLPSRLAALKANAEKRLVAHYRRVLPDVDGRPARTAWKYATSDLTVSWQNTLKSDCLMAGGLRPTISLTRRCRWVKRPTYHASLRYQYSVPKVDDATAYAQLALDRLGVRLDPSIVWNAIPFTFLVDWVFDVGGYLGTFARDNYQIDVKVREFMHSIAYSREAEIDLTYDADSALDGTVRFNHYPKRVQVGFYRGSFKSYDRKNANPSVTAARLRAPNIRQASLAASLIMSRTSWGRAQGYQYVTAGYLYR
jgi:hypothetical protein